MRVYYLLFGAFYSLRGLALIVIPSWMGIHSNAPFAAAATRDIWATCEVLIGLMLLVCIAQRPSMRYRFVCGMLTTGFASALATLATYTTILLTHDASVAEFWWLLVGVHFLFLFNQLVPTGLRRLFGRLQDMTTSPTTGEVPHDQLD